MVSLILREGDILDVSDSEGIEDLRTVANIDVPLGSNSTTREAGTGLTATGVLVAHIDFTDGSSGLFRLRIPDVADIPPPCNADFNADGDVDLGDFGDFGAAFGSMVGDVGYNTAADFDNDGDVDLSDFGTFGAEFGRTDCLGG